MKLKHVFISLLVCCSVAFSGCAFIEDMVEDFTKDLIQEVEGSIEESVGVIEAFCSDLSSGNLDDAAEKMHPDVKQSKEAFTALITGMEENSGVRFSDGIVLNSLVQAYTTYYDSIYGGKTYEIAYNASVGSKSVKLSFLVVVNEKGSGVYSFEMQRSWTGGGSQVV